MSPEEEKEESEKGEGKMGAFIKGMKEGEGAKGGMNYVLLHRLEFLYGILMLVGIVLSFFFIHIGGALVGLSVGLCFYKKILGYLSAISDLYNTEGLFKTIMILSVVLYLLISVPAFLVASIIGFVVMTFFTRVFR